MDDKLNIMFYS